MSSVSPPSSPSLIEGRITKMGVTLSKTPQESLRDLSIAKDLALSPPDNGVSSSSTHQRYVEYTLRMESQTSKITDEVSTVQAPLAQYLGQTVEVKFLGKISCVMCNKTIKKTYGDGLCYPCFMDSPSAAECVIRPILCRAHEGKGRDVEWELRNHAQPHLVYLALSNKYKVGVTRDWPTRWVDQGAAAVHVIAETPYRQLAGQIEVFLSQYYSDRTSWQRMLKGELLEGADLEREVHHARSLLPPELSVYGDVDYTPLYLNYPVFEAVTRVKSLKLDKIPELRARLIGARGQYLIFDGGAVLNLRAHTGYHAQVSIPESSQAHSEH